MNPKFLQMLGLAMRAGKVVSGEEQVVKAIRRGHIHLVLLSNDASSNTNKKITDKCAFYQVPCETVLSRDMLGQAIGKQERVVVGVIDKGFATRMQQYVKEV